LDVQLPEPFWIEEYRLSAPNAFSQAVQGAVRWQYVLHHTDNKADRIAAPSAAHAITTVNSSLRLLVIAGDVLFIRALCDGFFHPSSFLKVQYPLMPSASPSPSLEMNSGQSGVFSQFWSLLWLEQLEQHQRWWILGSIAVFASALAVCGFAVMFRCCCGRQSKPGSLGEAMNCRPPVCDSLGSLTVGQDDQAPQTLNCVGTAAASAIADTDWLREWVDTSASECTRTSSMFRPPDWQRAAQREEYLAHQKAQQAHERAMERLWQAYQERARAQGSTQVSDWPLWSETMLG
jgi:hypothetical protein